MVKSAVKQGVSGRRGSNQSGMRAHNERLVLTLVRQHEALPKSEIARITGLSAQTVSVIMRELEAEGFLIRGEPVRGKVGQPSVPMLLDAEGAYFYGLKVGRRSSEMVLVDFRGSILGAVSAQYAYPTPRSVTDFARAATTELSAALTEKQWGRIAGLGVATPFELWNWAEFIGAPKAEMDLWRGFDMQSELHKFCGCDVFVQNDATAACGAELVFGNDAPQDFLYIYIGFFVGGGLVLNRSLFAGRHGTSGALGPLPIPSASGAVQLLEIASIATLERRIQEAGGDGMALWAQPLVWDVDRALIDDWVNEIGVALAYAIVSATSVIDLEACLIDGWMPEDVRAAVVEATNRAINDIDVRGLHMPAIQPGTLGSNARSLGAASLPLSSRFLVDQNVL